MPLPTRPEIAAARKLLTYRYTSRYSTDVAFKLAVEARMRAISPDALRDAATEIDYEVFDDEPVRRSRRLDLETEYERRGQRRPLFVKVLIAGSGYNGWKTHVASDTGLVLNWDRADDQEDEKEAVHYKRDKGKGPELMFAGPGAGTTKGGSMFGGASDTGSNSITELVAQVTPMVEQAIDEGLSSEPDRPIVAMIKAHSRGAVAASEISTLLKAKYADIELVRVELAQVEPVAGPQHEGAALNIDLGQHDNFAGLDESTVVYSVASGYGWFFTPQKVRGAKRIIVSTQNHSVGLQNGFTYQGELYKGSSLNSLPEGVYIDMNKNGRNDIELRLVTNMQAARAAVENAWKKGESYLSDSKERMAIINAAVDEVMQRFLHQG